MRKLLRLSETMHDLQRLDGQLVKHICEMEEFEAASKQDRLVVLQLLSHEVLMVISLPLLLTLTTIYFNVDFPYSQKALSGSSKALIEEEKFRKSGKRKYEQITERMIALAGVLEQLNARNGSSSPIPEGQGSLAASASVDFTGLSSQGQALLRGKGNWQDRVELMHLHTTTHGTRRWSGGGDKESSIAPLNGESETSPKMPHDSTLHTAAPAASKSRLQSVATVIVTPAAVAAVNPFAAAAANPSSTASAVCAASLGPAVRPPPQPVLSQMQLGLGALAVRSAVHSKSNGSAPPSSGSITPRGKASASSLNVSIAAMNTSLATLSGSQRILQNNVSNTGKSSNHQKVGNENLGNLR